MDPIGLTVGLISTVAALAYKLHQLIAESEIAGDQFEDLVCEFKLTSSGLERLNAIFARSALPGAELANYKLQAANLEGILKDIEIQLLRIRHNLNSSTFITRFSQKRDLIDGDLRRLTSKMAGLNSSLTLLAMTYNCILSDLTYRLAQSNEDRLIRMESRAETVQNFRVDINLEYVQAVMKIQQEESATLPRYEEFQSTDQSVPVSSTNVGHLPVDSKLPMAIFTKETSDAGTTQYTVPSTPRIVNDPTPRSVSAPMDSYASTGEKPRCEDRFVAFCIDEVEKAQNEAWNSCAYLNLKPQEFVLAPKEKSSVATTSSYAVPRTLPVVSDSVPRSFSVNIDPFVLQEEEFRHSGWYGVIGLDGAGEAQDEAWGAYAGY